MNIDRSQLAKSKSALASMIRGFKRAIDEQGYPASAKQLELLGKMENRYTQATPDEPLTQHDLHQLAKKEFES